MENEEKQTIFKEEAEVENKASEEKTKTSSGLEPHIAGALSYVFGFVTGIIFLLIEKDQPFVKFHAIQSIIFSVVILLLNIILTAIPLIGWLLVLLLWPLSIVLWIILIFKASKSEKFKLPIIGDIAEKQI